MTTPFPEIETTEDPYTAPRARRIRIADCIQLSSKITGMPEEDILSRHREGRIAFARQLAMFGATFIAGYSLPMVGRHFDRDHTTVLAAREKVRKISTGKEARMKEQFVEALTRIGSDYD